MAGLTPTLPPTFRMNLLFLLTPEVPLILCSLARNPTAGTPLSVAPGPLLLFLCHSQGEETADWSISFLFPYLPFPASPDPHPQSLDGALPTAAS